MKPVYLNFTDEEGKKIKTFTTTSLKTGTMDNIFDLAERAEKFDEDELSISEVKSFYNDLKSVILSIFGYKFDFDELNEHVEVQELMRVFNEVCSNLGGELRKN